jgi:IS30 family transposase
MPRRAWNKTSPEVKRRYFELIRAGWSSQAASAEVGVSPSCGSLWFIDAGSVTFVEKPISSRYLSQDDRIEIADGLAARESVKEIAARIGKSYQSVYREIARNKKSDGTYQPYYAHAQAHQQRRRPRVRRVVSDEALRRAIAGKLEVHWSPAQISRWLRRRWPQRPRWHLCTETIYESVYRGLVVLVAPKAGTLRTGRTYRHKRGRGRTREGALKQLTNLKSIHDRPPIVETRSRVGDWEGDLIIGAGHRSAVATLVERKYRLTLLIPIRGGHTAQNVGDALIAAYSKLPPSLRRTLTWDQGNEMFHHARVEAEARIAIYFADPHSPWQRGSNENANGLLRQYLPKGTDFDTVDDDRIREIAAELNDRPRLCLGDRSPSQLMGRWRAQLVTI